MSPRERAIRAAWCVVIAASVATWPARWAVRLRVGRAIDRARNFFS